MNDLYNFISIFYIIANNLIIYIIITNVDYYLKNYKNKKSLKTIYKKIITIITSIVIGYISINILNEDLKTIITSALLSIVFYDYIVKYIIKGIKIKTKKIDN